MRSGSTWQYNIAAELLETCRTAKRIGFADSERTLRKWISRHNDIVIKIHEPFEAAISDVNNRQARMLYIFRDLRDVAASLMRYENCPLHQILESGRLESLWQHHQVWSRLPGALVQQYEQMMANPVVAAQQIARFLKLDISDESIREITHQNSLEVRRREREARRCFLDLFLSRPRAIIGTMLRKTIGWQRTNQLVSPFGYLGGRGVDRHTQLHSNHFAGGAVGSYRQVMTLDEQEKIEVAVSRIRGDNPENRSQH